MLPGATAAVAVLFACVLLPTVFSLLPRHKAETKEPFIATRPNVGQAFVFNQSMMHVLKIPVPQNGLASFQLGHFCLEFERSL
jgi:hypothetical protein